ncbi:MAG: Vitamin B12 dependent methionine synthase activation subunit [Kiritimatiellae bacterium]|nr:Vitamin B12 dependent methionine synthase activation subunit [Kiritimatiellia bacterium]
MLKVDRAEALRYMRMGAATPDDEMLRRLEKVERDVLASVRPASCREMVAVSDAGPEAVRVGPLLLPGRDLRRALAGCGRAFLFAATLGAGVDAYLRRCGQTSAADLVMAQGVATALIEAYCDECCRDMASSLGGAALAPRFSPGYGDLPLSVQRPLLEALDASRRAGVALTDSFLMVPSKSVSAIVGVRDPAD